MTKGYIQIYTGTGKGKTTAAFGLAIRAALSGKKVYIGQFIKGMLYQETQITKYLPTIEIEQYGNMGYIDNQATKEDIDLASAGLDRVKERAFAGEIDVLILDELNVALYYHLLSIETIVDFLKDKPQGLEVVITGRYCPEPLIEIADLVTDMQEVKHYYQKGVASRKGIDF